MTPAAKSLNPQPEQVLKRSKSRKEHHTVQCFRVMYLGVWIVIISIDLQDKRRVLYSTCLPIPQPQTGHSLWISSHLEYSTACSNCDGGGTAIFVLVGVSASPLHNPG